LSLKREKRYTTDPQGEKMTKTKRIALSTVFLLSLGAASAMADCTPEQVIQMHDRGLSQELIESICGSSQQGQRCVTEYGVCKLPAPANVGTPCSCTNKYTGRSDRGTVQK